MLKDSHYGQGDFCKNAHGRHGHASKSQEILNVSQLVLHALNKIVLKVD
jgi:hypothetical protein